MQFKYAFISAGMVTRGELVNHNATFTQVSNELSNKPAREEYEVIGHGAGSWRYYPMGVNKKGIVYGNGYKNKKTPALNIIKLIDTSISINSNMSIELDAHYAPSNHKITNEFPDDGAYILHDRPDWRDSSMTKESAMNYLHENTLKKAIDHITSNNYYQKSKVYVEIKATKNCINITSQDSDCQEQCQNLAKELKDDVSIFLREDGENWLCITSFSPAALTSFRSALPDAQKDSFDYVLIAGYTGGWPKSWLAQSKGYVPEFNKEISSFIVNTEWLDCIWFSAQGIPKFNELFNSIIAEREDLHPEWEEVDFSFSTYQKKETKMKKLMTKTPKLNARIRSFMLDLDYRIE